MPFGVGPLEIVIVLVLLLVVFGAKRLPEIGRSLGSSAREFKEGITSGPGETPAPQPEAEPVSKARQEQDGEQAQKEPEEASKG